MNKQKNQPCFTINLNSKVFCPLFYKKVRRTANGRLSLQKEVKSASPKDL